MEVEDVEVLDNGTRFEDTRGRARGEDGDAEEEGEDEDTGGMGTRMEVEDVEVLDRGWMVTGTGQQLMMQSGELNVTMLLLH